MIDRRSMLLGSVSTAVLATAGDKPTAAELRLLATAAAPESPSVEDYNRTRIVKGGTAEKKMIESLEARGFFKSTTNFSDNVACDYFVELTDKGWAALREAGVVRETPPA